MARRTGTSSALIFEELEPRVLFSADGAEALAVEVVQEQEYEEPVIISEEAEDTLIIVPEENSTQASEQENTTEQADSADEPEPEAATAESSEKIIEPEEQEASESEEPQDNPEPLSQEGATAGIEDDSTNHELVLVNSDVRDKELLIEEVEATGKKNTEYEIIILDSEQDGVQQVSDILAEQNELDAIHFVSHGDEGELAVGNDWLTSDALEEQNELISTWSDALSEDGDVLLYGCSIAGDSEGEDFVDQFATLTGADVAASDDTSGSSALGGDWELEYVTGELETAPLFSTLTSWEGTLTTYAYEGFDYPTGSGQLDEQTGGEGWSTEWSSVGNYTKILDYSLSDPTGTLITSGGSVQIQSSFFPIAVTQSRDTDISLGADGTTVWFSFLLEPEISLPYDSAGISFGDVFVGHYGTSFIIQEDGQIYRDQTDDAVDGEAALLVVQVDFANGNDTISLYINPTPGESTPDVAAIAVNTDLNVAGDNAFQEISITGNGNIGYNTSIIDELRIGDSYADVTPANVSAIIVNTTGDVKDGDVDSIDDLIASPGDDGVISLREAIEAANNTLGTDTIQFDVDGPIVLDHNSGVLPDITDTIIIDGTSDPDYAGTPVIQIDGSYMSSKSGDEFDGLRLVSGSDGSIIKGLSITGFNDGGEYGEAIEILSDNNTIIGNYIGIAPDGTSIESNSIGISLAEGASGNSIGSVNEGSKNIITGNSYADISISGDNSDDNIIQGNDIGLDVTGETVVTSNYGIVISNGADNNAIGGTETGAGNNISGHDTGVLVDDGANNSILGNAIYDNQLMAIDLNSDNNANDQLNYPVITTVNQNGDNLDVTLYLDAPAGDYRIELFENPNGIDVEGVGEGQTYLGSFTVTSNDSGLESFSKSIADSTATDLSSITATTTEYFGSSSYGSTSEFSPLTNSHSVTLNPIKDTYIREDSDANYGTSTSLLVDKSGGDLGDQRTLIEFDISAIPANATITSATLQLNATGTGNFTVNVYEMIEEWLEGDGDYHDAANWEEATETKDWTYEGALEKDSTEIIASTNGNSSLQSWDITSLVSAWFSGSSTNYGVMLASPDNGHATITYSSSESSNPPELIISYTTPTTNTAPVLDPTPLVGLDAVEQEAGEPNGSVGTLVADLVDLDDSNGLDNVTDPDDDALTGIALTNTDTTNGTWYYSIDDGSNWIEVGTVNDNSARLLAADSQTRIYFQPDSTVTSSITFRAWDQTEGINGGLADVNDAGGETAFSTAHDTAFITVNSVPEVEKTETAITVDGTIDAAWDAATDQNIELVTKGSVEDADDLSGSFRTLWDDTNLYVLVEVTDDTLTNDSTNIWHDDTIEVFIDPDYSQGSAYDGLNDYQIGFRIADGTIVTGENSQIDTTGVEFDVDIDTGSYTVEIALPWDTLNVSPAGGDFIGFEIQIDDDDDGDVMDAKMSWNVASELVNTDPSLFGTMQLIGNTTPVITGDSAGSVTEDENPDIDGYLEATGALTITDADEGESSFQAATVNSTYGSLTIDDAGNWSYKVENELAVIQQIDTGEHLTDTINVTAFDGTSHEITITILGAEDAPVVGGEATATLSEDDTLVSDIITISDTDNSDNPILWQAVGPTGGINGFGDFQIATDGSWNYTLNNTLAAVQELKAGDSLTDTFTCAASDGTTHELTVTIQGADDAPSFSGTDEGTVFEEDDPATLEATGDLDITDVDAGDALFQAEPTIAGLYGTLSIDVAGNWTYQANNTQTAIQQLDTGESIQDTIAVQSEDGTSHNITITINGVDDSTIIGGETSKSLTEDQTPPTLQVSGVLTIDNPDIAKEKFVAETIAGSFGGDLIIDQDGNWTYSASNSHSAIQALGAGETIQDIITIKSVDDTEEHITITIEGVNDAPEISGATLSSVTEDVDPDTDNLLETSGNLSITDADTGEDSFQAETIDGTYGSLTIESDGEWRYEADNTQTIIQQLDGGTNPTDTFLVTSADGSDTRNITVTVYGVEDAPTVGGITSGSVAEDGSLTSSETLTIDDIDQPDSPYWGNLGETEGDNGFGNFQMNSGTWTYTLDNDAVQGLDAGETATDSYTFTASDLTTQQTVTITIHGAEDSSDTDGDFTGTVAEDSQLTTTGSLTISDVDTADSPTWQNQLPTLGDLDYGYFAMTGGNWVYTLINSSVQGLHGGEHLTDTFTFKATDNSTQQVTITINGTEDAPLVGGPSTGTVAEDGSATSNGQLTITDVDHSDDPSWNDQADTAGANGYGNFQMTAGQWTYTLNNTVVQFLDNCETASDNFTFIASDGTTQQVTISIDGEEDTAIASGTNTGSVTEGDVGDGPETANGTFTLTDPDSIDNPSFDDVASTIGDSGYGYFGMSASTWTYTLDQSTVQNLNSTQNVSDSFTFTATDGTTRTVTITISGTNESLTAPPVVVEPTPEEPPVEPTPEEEVIAEEPDREEEPEQIISQPEQPEELEQEPPKTPVIISSEEENDDDEQLVVAEPDVEEESSNSAPDNTTDDSTDKTAKDEDDATPADKQKVIVVQEAEAAGQQSQGISTHSNAAGSSSLIQASTGHSSLNSTTSTRQFFTQRPTMASADTTDLLLTRFIEQAAFTSEVEYAEAVSQLRDALDTFREETQDQAQYYKTVVGSAIAVSTGLSVGYVVWLVRGGMLLSSVLFSMPAWQLADPLPLLSKSQNLDDQDDEDLEKIIQKGSATAAQASAKGRQRDSGSRG